MSNDYCITVHNSPLTVSYGTIELPDQYINHNSDERCDSVWLYVLVMAFAIGSVSVLGFMIFRIVESSLVAKG